MPTYSSPRLRAFVRRHTRVSELPDLPGVRLHLADDAMEVMTRAGRELDIADPPLAFWAFAWAGGLAVARHLGEHPEEVAGRSVLDVASGSGLCAIAALRAGAASVLAIDTDPLAGAAVAVNAGENGLRIPFRGDDLLDAGPPPCDVILAGDVCYEETMARRMVEWLGRAARRGTRVLIGDPGRRYLPPGLELVAEYRVQTSRELEDSTVKVGRVFTIARAR